MAGPALPPTPAPLKSIQHYLKIAAEHDQRDPVVSYWCRLYALQTGLKLSTKTTEETNFLMKLMDWLETTKKAMHNNEAITNNVVAQAHLENWALKLFMYADHNDRNSNFEKSTIQSFYTAGLLYDVITTFGDLTEEAVQNRKYAKWKAAYIHNCLKNGETPVAGPLKQEGEEDGSDSGVPTPPTSTDAFGFPSVSSSSSSNVTPPKPLNIPPERKNFVPVDPNPYNPAPTPTNPGNEKPSSFENFNNLKTEGGVTLNLDQMTKAQKLIKWAGSALNYDDVPTTVMNLRKALHLLTTGQELP